MSAASRPHLRALESPPSNDALAQAPVEPLVAAVLRGEESAMHALGMRILPRVRNAVRYLVRGDQIDDLVQDTLVTVIERLASFAGTGRFESWVDGVTVRVVIGRMRKQRATQRREAPLAIDQYEPGAAGDPARYATSRQLVRALDRLSDNHRSALCLHHVFGWTVPEIALELEIPQETVRTRLRDGMGQLRALLRVTPAGSPG